MALKRSLCTWKSFQSESHPWFQIDYLHRYTCNDVNLNQLVLWVECCVRINLPVKTLLFKFGAVSRRHCCYCWKYVANFGTGKTWSHFQPSSKSSQNDPKKICHSSRYCSSNYRLVRMVYLLLIQLLNLIVELFMTWWSQKELHENYMEKILTWLHKNF